MNNTALITGTSSGVGLAISTHLIDLGWKVIGISRNCNALLTSKNYIHKYADIRNSNEILNVFSEIKNERVNLLINNAAVFSMNSFVNTSVDIIDNIIDTNIKGTMHITKYAINLMVPDSRIIFINSVAGLEELENQSIYCSSKYALTAFAGVLGKELRTHGIRVTSIHPGGIDTPLWSNTNPYPPGNVKDAIDPSKLAELVEFIYNSPMNIDYKTIKLFPTIEWH